MFIKGNVFISHENSSSLAGGDIVWEEIQFSSLQTDLSSQEAVVEGKENKTFIIAIFFLH